MNEPVAIQPVKKTGRFVIYRSVDETQWAPVKPGEVPSWIKEPDIISHLASGFAVQDKNDGAWYGAISVDTLLNQSEFTAQ